MRVINLLKNREQSQLPVVPDKGEYGLDLHVADKGPAGSG